MCASLQVHSSQWHHVYIIFLSHCTTMLTHYDQNYPGNLVTCYNQLYLTIQASPHLSPPCGPHFPTLSPPIQSRYCRRNLGRLVRRQLLWSVPMHLSLFLPLWLVLPHRIPTSNTAVTTVGIKGGLFDASCFGRSPSLSTTSWSYLTVHA